MNAPANIEIKTGLALLREPFPPNLISKLPKETKAQREAREKDKSLIVWKCELCGGAHHKAANHLDYVGHAALTDRLLDADPSWNWEPLAFTPEGLPAFDKAGGLWIKLTVCGQTRLGYGHAASKPNQDPGAREKEVIGDALRNAAMRFGAALDLWHKGDLHADDEAPAEASKPRTRQESKPKDEALPAVGMPDHAFAKLANLLKATNTLPQVLVEHYAVKDLRFLTEEQYEDAVARLEDDLARLARQQTNNQTQQGDGFNAGALAGANLG